MKIGILTYHWVYNFGANLQSLATVSWLRMVGHEVQILNYRPRDLESRYRANTSPQQAAAHEQFTEDYLPLSPLCRTDEDLREAAHGLDLLISGSDAVFRVEKDPMHSCVAYPNPFWMGWAESLDIPKVAFAASCMGSRYAQLSRKKREGIRKAISQFKVVSARDLWTQFELFKVQYGRRWPSRVPDPVLMAPELPAFKEHGIGSLSSSGKTILISAYPGMIEHRWLRRFASEAGNRGYDVVELPIPDEVASLPIVERIEKPLDPLAWYQLISNCAAYVGIRFHPIVVAIANSVPFLSIDSYRTDSLLPFSSKTFDLCWQLGLSGRCKGGLRGKLADGASALVYLFSDDGFSKKCERGRLHAAGKFQSFAAEHLQSAAIPKA